MKTQDNYRQCTLSVMDTIADPDITFDEKGICNYYYDYLEGEAEHVKKGEQGKRRKDPGCLPERNTTGTSWHTRM